MKKVLLILIINIYLYSSDFKNDLEYETSPYLLQHASNPIKWMPWGKKAFKRAKKENKPIFLSIGYSTCHWCHVMAEESFTNEHIAKLFNDNFICIKVDREEMPHLDSYYQALYLKLKGQNGGWPLNIFLTSTKEPFLLYTYIPAKKLYKMQGFDTLLLEVAHEYTFENFKIQKKVQTIKQVLQTKQTKLSSDEAKISPSTLQNSFHEIYDDIYGGFEGDLKFPEAAKLSLMLDIAQLQSDEVLKENYFEMLDLMALRGLYDHVDGGFFRYAVDSSWKIPHFEKMLYNQGELLPLYVKAYLLSEKPLYKNVVIETIGMLEKRFTKEGLYYSASDADTHHKEGAYFTFSKEEMKHAFQNIPDAKSLKKILKITAKGNFEGKTHLNIYDIKRPKNYDKFNKELVKIRKTKEYPFIDKKINTAWNAMMIEALFVSAKLDAQYLLMANKHLDALSDLMFDKGELYHQTILTKKPIQLGLLEDYAFFIGALLAAYEAEYDESKLDFAVYLLEKAKAKFYKNGIWYLSSDALKVKANMKDKYYTSALGKMLENILKLSALKASFEYEKLAQDTLSYMNETIQKEQANTPASAKAFLMLKEGVVLLKSNTQNLQINASKIMTLKYPFVVSKTNKKENYLACTLRSCFAIEKTFKLIENKIQNRVR